MSEVFASPLFSVFICIVAFELGIYIQKKTKMAACNPLLIAIATVIIILKLLQIPIESFNQGAAIINLFLAPATVVLAIPMYTYFQVLKQNLVPILIGTFVGAFTSMASVFLFAKMLGLNNQMIMSILPKSVTTPIAIEVSIQKGGIAAITVAVVVVTGIIGAVIAPALIQLFKLDHGVARGLAIGACSHALGTTKAIELGELEGAMSGIAIGVTGIFTVILSLFI